MLQIDAKNGRKFPLALWFSRQQCSPWKGWENWKRKVKKKLKKVKWYKHIQWCKNIANEPGSQITIIDALATWVNVLTYDLGDRGNNRAIRTVRLTHHQGELCCVNLVIAIHWRLLKIDTGWFSVTQLELPLVWESMVMQIYSWSSWIGRNLEKSAKAWAYPNKLMNYHEFL